jgi:hypothetical protein
MSKYTFIEFIAAQEGDDFNVIEGDNLAWARSFVKGMGDLPNWEHEGDCTKENYTCTLCVYELYLKEYREYYFQPEFISTSKFTESKIKVGPKYPDKQHFGREEMDFIKRCIEVYWEHYANSSHEDNLDDWNTSQNILNK